MQSPWPTRVVSGLVLMAAVLSTSACYAYRRTGLSPAPQSQVRIVLTSSTPVMTYAADSVSSRSTHPGVLEAAGTVIAAASDTIALRLGELRTSSGAVPKVAGRVAMLPVSQIARIEERRFQAGPTLLGGLGLVLLAASVVVVGLVIIITRAAG